jgi:hypothetical protein
MSLRWQRDVVLLRPLLHQLGEEELRARWRAYVRTMDEYLARKGWNVPTFAQCIDRYVGEEDRAELVRRWNLRHRQERDPLTGVRTLR